MSKILKLMPDYNCFPLWKIDDELGNVNPDDLPLSTDVKVALRTWADAYDKTLNQEYPPDSGFASPAEEEDFEAEGKRLWKVLQEQLGPDYRVAYFSNREIRLLE